LTFIQNIFIYTTHIKKVIARLYCFILRSKIAEKQSQVRNFAQIRNFPWHRATVNIVTLLQQGMRWDVTSLVQSVNLICDKKVYYSNRPKYFVPKAESREKSLKLVLDRWSKFGWMKNQLQFCFLKFKVVLLFVKSLNLSPLNSKYLENS